MKSCPPVCESISIASSKSLAKSPRVLAIEGIPDRPKAPLVIFRFKANTRTTSPNPKVAMAKYIPCSRVVGIPITSATSVDMTPPRMIASGMGRPACIVKMADV